LLNILFAGREVRIGKNCARGLEYEVLEISERYVLGVWMGKSAGLLKRARLANQIQGYGVPDRLDAREK